MDTGVKDKIVVATGASEGIGKAIAKAFLHEGATVVICSHSPDKLETARDELAQSGGQVLAVTADLSTAEGANTLKQRTLEAFGTVHVLINNVGVPGTFAPFMDLSDEDWQRVFEVNVMSAVRVSRVFIPSMQEQQWGRIIHMASESGVQPDAVAPQYGMTKAALINLTKSMSKAFASDNILVNAISPAFVMTSMLRGMIEGQAKRLGVGFEEAVSNLLRNYRPHIELKRPGRAEEVAAAAVFLASERASFVTGINLRVDGGSVASL